MSDTTLFTVSAKGDSIGVGCEPPATSKTVRLGDDWVLQGALTYAGYPVAAGETYGLSYFRFLNVTAKDAHNRLYCEPGAYGVEMRFGSYHRTELPLTVRRECDWLQFGTPELYTTTTGYRPLTYANLLSVNSKQDTGNVVFITQPFTFNIPLYSILPALADASILRHPVVTHAFNSNFDLTTGMLSGIGEYTFTVPNAINDDVNVFTSLGIVDALADFPNRVGDSTVQWGDTLIEFDSQHTTPVVVGTPSATERRVTTYLPQVSNGPMAYPWNIPQVLAAYDTEGAKAKPIVTLPIVIDWFKDGTQ